MNKMNTYTYEVHKNINNIPLHIVSIRSYCRSSFMVFSNSKDAREFIEKQKKIHAQNNINLQYDPNHSLAENLLQAYVNCNTGLFSDTYTKTMYINYGNLDRHYIVA